MQSVIKYVANNHVLTDTHARKDIHNRQREFFNTGTLVNNGTSTVTFFGAFTLMTLLRMFGHITLRPRSLVEICVEFAMRQPVHQTTTRVLRR